MVMDAADAVLNGGHCLADAFVNGDGRRRLFLTRLTARLSGRGLRRNRGHRLLSGAVGGRGTDPPAVQFRYSQDRKGAPTTALEGLHRRAASGRQMAKCLVLDRQSYRAPKLPPATSKLPSLVKSGRAALVRFSRAPTRATANSCHARHWLIRASLRLPGFPASLR